MSARVERTNQEGLAELRGPGREEALADLHPLLVRGLRVALADRPSVTEADLEDFAQEALVKMLMEMVQRVIAEELTDRQRQAMVAAVFGGMPLEEVARRMGTNRNALYKLLHDGRQRLKRRMLAMELPPQSVLAAFEPQTGVRGEQPTTSQVTEGYDET